MVLGVMKMLDLFTELCQYLSVNKSRDRMLTRKRTRKGPRSRTGLRSQYPDFVEELWSVMGALTVTGTALIVACLLGWLGFEASFSVLFVGGWAFAQMFMLKIVIAEKFGYWHWSYMAIDCFCGTLIWLAYAMEGAA